MIWRWMRFWARAVRPEAYSTSFMPIALGGLYARWLGAPFSTARFIVAIAAGMLLHTAANLWNDYFDYTGGVDVKGYSAGSGMLVSGELAPARCFRAAVLCAILAALGGLWLAWQTGWGILLLGLFGLGGAVGYCAGPHSPKHHAMGELLAFLMVGPGMTLGGCMAQTGMFSIRAILVGIPLGLISALLLYNNNMRDIESDQRAGIRTLPVRLNDFFHTKKAAVYGAYALCMAGWLLTAACAVLWRLPWIGAGLAVVLVPIVVWMWRIRAGRVTECDQRLVAIIHTVLGLGLAIPLACAG